MEVDELEKLIEGGVETPQLDFKESIPWYVRGFAKDLLAMSNTQDGGRIIIGVAEEKNGSFSRKGITPEHKASYKIDEMKDQMARYADPFVEFSVVFQKDKDGVEYGILRVEPFREIPVMCRVPDSEYGLFAGGIYNRNTNKKVESALVSNSYDMRDIVERAMLKMRYRAKQIGYVLPTDTEGEPVMKVLEERLKKERGDL